MWPILGTPRLRGWDRSRSVRRHGRIGHSSSRAGIRVTRARRRRAALLRQPVPAGRSRRDLSPAALRADRRHLGHTGPARFTFNVKAFQPVHPATHRGGLAARRPARGGGPDRPRPGVPQRRRSRAVDQAWDRFLSAPEPLNQAGKLGAILLQFPPWFPASRAGRDCILACARRVAPRHVTRGIS
jgi:hypothetical protein